MPNSTRHARCRFTAFGEATLSFPYSRPLVDAIKDSIPYRYRSYDSTSKEWRVWGGFEDLAIELLLQFFPDAEVPTRHQTRAGNRTRRAGDDHFATLHLLPSAPRQVVDAAYRALAKLYHPDVGGDPATMRRLLEAREALSRRLSA